MNRLCDKNRGCWTTWPTRLLAAATVLGILASGCGPSGPKRLQVHGKVTFNGAPPRADGSVYFSPVQAAKGFPARGGYGTFVAGDGSYVVGSVKPDDGLMPGRYRVTIECFQQPPIGGSPGKSLVPAGYVAPELDIKADDAGPNQFDLDVRPPS